MRTQVAFVALTAASVALSPSARARAADPASAQVLFDEGKRLMASHAYAQACPKFEESQRLDPGMGTLFHLAECDERIGKTASAWAAYLEVAAEAKAQGEPARATAASERATALEPTLSKLAIDPGPERATRSLAIVRDGLPIGEAQWSTAIPVDPGPHAIEARAPGKRTWSTTINVVAGVRELVTVPALLDAPIADVTPAPAVAATTTTGAELDTSTRGNGQRIAGIALGAAGLVGVGIGGYFGIVSLGRHGDAQSHCSAAGCDSAGTSLLDDAHRAGDASTIAFAAGGAFVLAGIITYVTAPRSSLSAPAVADARPAVSFGPGGVSVRGTW